jgi:hypothetical protein
VRCGETMGWAIFKTLLDLGIKVQTGIFATFRGATPIRVVAQSGSVFAWGARGRWFESSPPDKNKEIQQGSLFLCLIEIAKEYLHECPAGAGLVRIQSTRQKKKP